MAEGAAPTALDADARRELLTVLTAEHTNLQAARSTGMVEANGRTTAFFAALSGSLVALALAAQVRSLDAVLAGLATLLVVTVLYIGVVTYLRLAQLAQLDSLLVLGINRVRHEYLELVPRLAAVEVLSAYDDLPGIIGGSGLTGRTSSRLDMLVAAPGMVASVDGILAGVVCGLVATQLGAAMPGALTIGVTAGVVTDLLLIAYGVRSGARFWRAHPPSHPMPRS